MEYLKNWWSSIDRINIILILSLGFTGLILSFSIDENLSINRHSIFFLFSMPKPSHIYLKERRFFDQILNPFYIFLSVLLYPSLPIFQIFFA